MRRRVTILSDAFEIISEACVNVKDHDACSGCPMGHLCLEDPEVSVIDIGDLVSSSSWDEFLEYSGSVEFSGEDLDAQWADFRRKYEEEERMLDEYFG